MIILWSKHPDIYIPTPESDIIRDGFAFAESGEKYAYFYITAFMY